MNITNETSLILIVGTLVMGMLVTFIIAFVFMYHRAQLRFQIAQQKLKQAQLESEIEIRQQTLHSISRELHDNFGQVLSLIKLNLGYLSKSVQAPQREILQEANNQITTLLNEIRDLSHNLSNEKFENNQLPELIEQDLNTIGKQDGISIQFGNEVKDLPETNLSLKILLYRMFQELTNNVIKHAEATHLSVNMKSDTNQVYLSVKDNGKGFDSSKQVSGQGFSNLRNRCNLIKARLKVKSIEGAGTEVVIAIPKNKMYETQ